MTTNERRLTLRKLTSIVKSNRLGGRSPKSLIAVAIYLVLKSRPETLASVSRTMGLATNTSAHCLHLLTNASPSP